jgi:hypothetical protein
MALFCGLAYELATHHRFIGHPENATAPPQDFAGAVTDNYASCRYDQIRLGALQEIVKTILHGEVLPSDE